MIAAPGYVTVVLILFIAVYCNISRTKVTLH